ncbi:Rqc2 family fibronectin-binding protein [Fundicoccus culcitae]|uniref:Rqc2 homolog RqcH n=1 Tax=Fundicoccus culcitae TaxID=2969821 RepID=A0ABY5P776_9LACT|nr:NFACT RNA binding domain-containing protein [Fundicoccus culcitae]UUX34441.1 NFACT family protein [Fundicoccus culcitae]
MTLDGFFIHALVKELRNELLQGRISKIYQPFEQEIQMVIRANRKNIRLAASIHPVYYHINVTQERTLNPEHAPLFSMLLRKHLEGAIIQDIQQVENDRMIDFELSGRDELGDTQSYRLIFELMGRNSNIILLNPQTNKIIDCIKHVPSSQNTFRTLLPGADYQRPPENKQQINPFNLSGDELNQWTLQHPDELNSRKNQQWIQGLGKSASQALIYWMEQDGLTAYEALKRLMDGVDAYTPLMFESNQQLSFYAMDLPQIEGHRQLFDTLSRLLDHFYAQRVRLDRIKNLSGNIVQQLEQIIEKNNKKLEKLAKDYQVAQAADLYRVKGELLSAYAYQIPKGETQVALENYYEDNALLTIDLDPRKTAIENSQQYFKKYSKYRDALKYIDQQKKLTHEENDYLETVLVQLNQADLEDIEDIKQELQKLGYQSQRKNNAKKRTKTKSKPRRFRSTEGVLIYVGRNNQQNDELSLKKAAKNHWWLHTKDIPGAHVIVESDKPSQQTMTEAAEIAAYYSKFQHSANVPVDTVQVKHLHKPNGAKPGFVIYEGQQTLYVTPDEATIQALAVEET